MSTMKSTRRAGTGAENEPPPEVVDRFAELLPEGALDDAVRGLKPDELSGPGGLLSQLAGRVVEAALEAEMTEHLGHPPGGIPQPRQPVHRVRRSLRLHPCGIPAGRRESAYGRRP